MTPRIAMMTTTTAAVAALTMSGCGAGGSAPDGAEGKSSVMLGYSQPATDPFQAAEARGVIDRYKDQGYGYLPAVNAGGSASQQLNDVKTLVTRGAKGTVMSVLDAQAIVPAIEYANQRKVPIVTIDEAPAGGKVSMIVRADNVAMGELACEEIGKRVKPGLSVLTLDGDPTSSNGRDRTNGFNDCMAKKYPAITLNHVATKWSAATAASGLQTSFNQNPDIAAVYVQSDAVFYPTVLDTLQKIGKTVPAGQPGHLVLVSIDAGPAALRAITGGQQDAAIEQPLLDYIDYGVRYVTEAVDGKTWSAGPTDHGSTIAEDNGNLVDLLPTPVVTKDNVDAPERWGSQPFAKEAFAS